MLTIWYQIVRLVKYSQQGLFIAFFAGSMLLGKKAKGDPLAIDSHAQNFFQGQERIGQLDWFGNSVMGNAVPNAALGLGFLSYGLLAEDDHSKYSGLAIVETTATTALVVSLIKEMTNRTRPDGSDDLSFPSAHTAFAFSTASVLNEFYGGWVGISAYTLASATAITRMQDNKHWLTDTVAGAFIGAYIGIGFSKYNLGLYEKKQKEKSDLNTLRIDPVVGTKFTGVRLIYEF